MDALRFSVPGEVRGKGRPRIGKIGNHARMFTDRKTANYESLVALAAETALAGRQPFDCAIEVHIQVRIVPTASASKAMRSAMLADEIQPTKKPDIDNVVKAILDGCNAVAFRDDVLVVKGSQWKRYAATAGVDVLIKPYVREG